MVDALIGGVEKPEDVGIHYFLLDACVTFLGWPALFPVPPRGGAAPTLMSYLVSPHSSLIHGTLNQHQFVCMHGTMLPKPSGKY